MADEKFSFFPDPPFAPILSAGTTSELVELFRQQPDMSGRFMHELIGLGRVQDLKDVLESMKTFPGFFEFVVKDITASTGIMRSMLDVSKQDTDAFTRQAVTILNEVGVGFTLSPLEIIDFIDSMMRNICSVLN